MIDILKAESKKEFENLKSRKLKLSAILLACAVILLSFAFIGIKPRAETNAEDICLTENAVFIGEDSESLYNLRIGMKVYYDTETETYSVFATAEWQNAKIFTESEKCAEKIYGDFILLRWGGEGALRADSDGIDGEYRNGNKIDFSDKTAAVESSIVWQFAEKSKSSQMSFAKATFKLKRTGEVIGRETAVRMAYVHTYGKLNATIPVIFGRGLSADKISYKKLEHRWQIEISVPSIEY